MGTSTCSASGRPSLLAKASRTRFRLSATSVEVVNEGEQLREMWLRRVNAADATAEQVG